MENSPNSVSEQAQTPSIDAAAAEQYINAVFGAHTDNDAYVAFATCGPNTAFAEEYTQISEIERSLELGSKLIQRNNAGANVYVSLALYGEAKRASEHASHTLGVVADLDNSDSAAMCDRALETGQWPGCITPSMVVRTSKTGSHNRYQALYLFHEAEADLAGSSQTAAKVTQLWGADTCSKVNVQVWRVPGFINWPDVKKQASGRQPELSTFALADTGCRYSLADFDHLPDPVVAAVDASAAAQGDNVVAIRPTPEWAPTTMAVFNRLHPKLREKIAQGVPKGQRSEAVANVVKWMLEEGVSLTDAFSILWAHPHGLGERFAERGHGPGTAALWKEVQRLDAKWRADGGDVQRIMGTDEEVAALMAALGKTEPTTSKFGAPSSSSSSKMKTLDTISADALMEMVFTDPRWAVEPILPEGLSVLAGKPKLGKSWLMLGIGIAVASGGAVLGKYNVQQGDVLYLAMEDTQRRLKKRLGMMLGPQEPVPSRLDLTTKCSRLDEGGLEQIAQWLEDHPDARLVVIDTWAKVKPRSSKGVNVYEEDYRHASALKELADQYGVAIIGVHHLKKGQEDDWIEEMSGSMGLPGAADTLWGLFRSRGQMSGELKMTGRDIDEQELALNFDKTRGLWTCMGSADDFRHSQEREEILNLLRQEGSMKAKAVAEALEIKLDAAKKRLRRMEQDGLLYSIGGTYALETTK